MGIKSMAKNRDVFLVDPTTYTIPNNGVAKVIDPPHLKSGMFYAMSLSTLFAKVNINVAYLLFSLPI